MRLRQRVSNPAPRPHSAQNYDTRFRFETSRGSYGGLYSEAGQQTRLFTVVQVP
jgi:hypothetical protein